jgi:hypothetical protein
MLGNLFKREKAISSYFIGKKIVKAEQLFSFGMLAVAYRNIRKKINGITGNTVLI